MKTLDNKTVVVAGGTGNVGSYIVRDLLQRGANVAVPSRSETNLGTLKEDLSKVIDHQERLNRLHTFAGNVGDEDQANDLVDKITDSIGIPDAAIASLGRFRPAPSMLDVSAKDLNEVINDYLIAHFITAKTLLQQFKERGKGTYLFINGPLALKPAKGMGAGLVSTATAAQQMLFNVLAQELSDSKVRVTELVNYAYIRDHKTQPGSAISGEATGAYASYLVSDEATNIHGQSIRLQSMEQLEEIGITIKQG